MSTPPSKHPGHYWRKDITGLRALAVLPVLIFHAFPALIPGGFYGVDIFFVISGYLISGIIFRGLQTSTFSYVDFYEKRIKRILPNLIAVLLFVALLGWLFLTTEEYSSLGRHIYSSALFYQNFRLLSDVGYFDLTSIEKPLLHLWSLAIEEQFYIVFPVVCTILWRYTKQSSVAIGWFVAILTVGSLGYSLWEDNTNLRFYFPLSRFWELGFGICIAYLEIFLHFNTKRLDQSVRHALSVAGLLMVCAAMGLYTEEIPSARLFSLLPVLGSALLIFANEDAVINRTLLAWRFMSFIGLISYSLYLWHWPLISFLHTVTPQAPQWHYGIALLLSFPLALLTYSLIENPIRRIKGITGRRAVILLLSLLVGCFALGQTLRKSQGIPHRPIAEALSFTNEVGIPRTMHKTTVLGVPVRASHIDAFPEILFLGDSHMEQYAPRAKALSDKTGKSIAFLTHGGCLASIGWASSGAQECHDIPKQLKTLLQDNRIKTVVVSQMWGAYMRSIQSDFPDAIMQFIALFKEAGHNRKIYVLLDAPWDEDSFKLKNNLKNRLDIDGLKSADFFVDYPKDDQWHRGNQYVEERLKPYATLIKTEELVCPNQKCNLRFYKDDDHLNAPYVKENAFWLDQVFD